MMKNNKPAFILFAASAVLCLGFFTVRTAGAEQNLTEAPKIGLSDADKKDPVLYNLYVKGTLNSFGLPVSYGDKTGDPSAGKEMINVSSTPLPLNGNPGTRFMVYSMMPREGVKIEWALPYDADFERMSGVSLSRVVAGILTSRKEEYQSDFFDFSNGEGHVQVLDAAYEEGESGSFLQGYSIKVDSYPSNKGRFWRALGEIFALNVLGEVDYYMHLDANSDDWRYRPTWNGVRKKIADGPSLDANNFTTNAVGHLYSGNMYFTAARSNGYDFFHSTMFAIGGSVMWEYFGEFKEQVSANDIVFTGIGGAILGEGLTQTSIYIEKNFRRSFLRDTVVLLLNPMRMLNRYIDRSFNDTYTISISFINPAQYAAENAAR